MITDTQKARHAISELAADWFVRSRDAEFSDAEQTELARWLKESPVHVQEYLAVARLWGDVSDIEGVEEMVVPVSDINLPDGGNIVNLTQSVATRTASPAVDGKVTLPGQRRGNDPRRWAVAASFVLALGLAGTVWWYQKDSPGHHITELGEQRSLVLEDGSVVEMNTASEIEVAYGSSERYVTLRSGEVFFDVRKDSRRPFIVRTGQAEIIVLGTKFNVYKQAGETTITVLEGSVSVAADNTLPGRPPDGEISGISVASDSRRVHLKSGEQAVIDTTQKEITTVTLPDLEKYIAWTDRRLIFDKARLDRILAEFARYNRVAYRISNEKIAELRLTATFNSQDVESLVDYLEYHPEVSVTREGGTIVISSSPKTTDNQ